MDAIINLSPVFQTGLLILSVLVFASLVTALLSRLQPQKNFSELRARIKSWWIMASIFFGAVAVSNKISLVFFGFLSFWAFKEYITLLKTRPSDHRTLALAFLAIPIQYYWISIDWYGMFIVFIPVFMFLILPMRLVLSKETSGFVASVSQIQWGLMAFGFGLSHQGLLLMLPNIASHPWANGRTLVLFLVFIVEMSDVFQYVWGKAFGKHKILPAVSPNKTWEGFIGGIATTTLLSLFLRFLTPFSMKETIFVSLLITITGFCGGAVMSAVKRDFGVKDFGCVIPGHGGMLDRVDSLCYAVPVFLHYMRYFYY